MGKLNRQSRVLINKYKANGKSDVMIVDGFKSRNLIEPLASNDLDKIKHILNNTQENKEFCLNVFVPFIVFDYFISWGDKTTILLDVNNTEPKAKKYVNMWCELFGTNYDADTVFKLVNNFRYRDIYYHYWTAHTRMSVYVNDIRRDKFGWSNNITG